MVVVVVQVVLHEQSRRVAPREPAPKPNYNSCIQMKDFFGWSTYIDLSTIMREQQKIAGNSVWLVTEHILDILYELKRIFIVYGRLLEFNFGSVSTKLVSFSSFTLNRSFF